MVWLVLAVVQRMINTVVPSISPRSTYNDPSKDVVFGFCHLEHSTPPIYEFHMVCYFPYGKLLRQRNE